MVIMRPGTVVVLKDATIPDLERVANAFRQDYKEGRPQDTYRATFGCVLNHRLDPNVKDHPNLEDKALDGIISSGGVDARRILLDAGIKWAFIELTPPLKNEPTSHAEIVITAESHKVLLQYIEDQKSKRIASLDRPKLGLN